MDPTSIHRTVLPNGLTVLVQEDRSAPVVAIVTHVRAGYFDETDEQNGLAHALEHMFFKGTQKRGVGEIAKEMEVIIQEAKRKSDNPPAVATETLYELLHDAHRMRRWRIGREPGLRAFTRDMMNRFYRNFYRPSNTILSISGDVDPADALRRVQELYGELRSGAPERHPGPPEARHDDFRYRELSGDIAQCQLVFGWRTPGTLDPDTAVLDVAASVLATGRASRWYRAVREKKLASSITAYDYTPTELGVFVIHAETEPENTAEAARVIWDQLHQLRVGSIEDDEITRVRRIFEARWVRRLETAEGRANYLAEWEAQGGWQLGDEYYKRYTSASADDIQRVVRRYLSEEGAAALVYRPENAPIVAQDAADMKRILGEGGAERLPAIPRHPPATAPAEKNAEREKEEAGVSIF